MLYIYIFSHFCNEHVADVLSRNCHWMLRSGGSTDAKKKTAASRASAGTQYSLIAPYYE